MSAIGLQRFRAWCRKLKPRRNPSWKEIALVIQNTCVEQHEAVESATTIIEAQTARIAELEATVKERDAEIARYVRLNEAWDGFVEMLCNIAKNPDTVEVLQGVKPKKSKRKGR